MSSDNVDLGFMWESIDERRSFFLDITKGDFRVNQGGKTLEIFKTEKEAKDYIESILARLDAEDSEKLEKEMRLNAVEINKKCSNCDRLYSSIPADAKINGMGIWFNCPCINTCLMIGDRKIIMQAALAFSPLTGPFISNLDEALNLDVESFNNIIEKMVA